MKYIATISFAGNLCMALGEVRDLPATSPVVKDLLKAGYLVKAPSTKSKGVRNGKDSEG